MPKNSDKKIFEIDEEATGKHIGAIMADKGVSTRDMANMLGVSFQAVSGYLHGQRMPTLPHLFIIGQILGTGIDDLIVSKSYI